MEHAFIVPESDSHLFALAGFANFFLCLAEPVLETRDLRCDDPPVFGSEPDDVIAGDVDNDAASIQALKLSQEALCSDIRLLPNDRFDKPVQVTLPATLRHPHLKNRL
jgi:hypothetical protein